jgi:hypothetical protein
MAFTLIKGAKNGKVMAGVRCGTIMAALTSSRHINTINIMQTVNMNPLPVDDGFQLSTCYHRPVIYTETDHCTRKIDNKARS